jgi:hypothetical protein
MTNDQLSGRQGRQGRQGRIFPSLQNIFIITLIIIFAKNATFYCHPEE